MYFYCVAFKNTKNVEHYCKYQLAEEEFEGEKMSTVSILWCILKPYLSVFYHRISFYWEFLGES